MTQHFETLAFSRSGFLVGTGATAIAVAFGANGMSSALAASPLNVGAFVTIGKDGIVTVTCPASEMGQGTRTALPLILAEDLDADWSKVRVVPAGANAKLYGNPKFNNQQQTVGDRKSTRLNSSH